jgi:hypothetical protein
VCTLHSATFILVSYLKVRLGAYVSGSPVEAVIHYIVVIITIVKRFYEIKTERPTMSRFLLLC